MTDTEAVRWALPVTATLTERNCNRQGFSGGEAAIGSRSMLERRDPGVAVNRVGFACPRACTIRG